MPKNKPLRLVIDTNLWISFIISKKINDLEIFFINQDIKLIFSHELIEELQATMVKPKLRKFFSNHALADMLDVFDPYIDLIEVKSKVIPILNIK